MLTFYSPRKTQENLVAYYSGQQDLAIGNIVREFLTDSIIRNDSVIKWLEYNPGIYNNIALVQLYTQIGNYDKATTLAKTIKGTSGFNNVGTYLEQYVNVYSKGATWAILKTNPALRALIVSIANSTEQYGSDLAKGALALAFGTRGYEEILIPSASGSRLFKGEGTEKVVLNDGDLSDVKIEAYPNPFKNELNVSYNLDERYKNGNLALIDAGTGRVLLQYTLPELRGSTIFNTEALSPGVYLIKISGNGVQPKYLKVVNVK